MAVDMGKMVGPLPLGAWLIVVTAGVGITYWSYTRTGGSSSTDASNSDSGETSSDGSSLNDVGAGGSGMYWQNVAPDSTPSATNTPTDNSQWQQQVETWLTAMGFDSAAIDNAINGYLNGTKLTTQEGNLIAIALAHFGAPPDGLPPGSPRLPVAPINTPGNPPKHKPGKKPPSHHAPPKRKPKPVVRKPTTRIYTVKRGDTLWGISRKYYKNGNDWHRIFNANKGTVHNPNLIYPGQKLRIPTS